VAENKINALACLSQIIVKKTAVFVVIAIAAIVVAICFGMIPVLTPSLVWFFYLWRLLLCCLFFFRNLLEIMANK